MPLPAAVLTAVAVIETAVKVAEATQKIVGFLGPAPPDRLIEIARKLDQLSADLLRLRDEMRELGQRILLEIERTRLTIQLFELNRMLSLAESALHSLQTSRLTNSQFLKDAALRDSDFAVTELKNAQAFADHAAAIGPFMFVVNARLQIIAELASGSFSDAAFRTQINDWVGLLRNAANEFEAAIRAENNRRFHRNETIVGRRRVCAYDIESRRVVCEWEGEGRKRVTIVYSNISATIDYSFDSEDPSVGSGQTFRNALEAFDRGVQDDLQNLGINSMRRLANIWESTRRISLIPPIWTRILGRSLTEAEYSHVSEASARGEFDAERIVRGLLQTQEFLDQPDTAIHKDRTQGTVQTIFQRVVGRDPQPDELRVHSELHEQFGYIAFIAAVSTLVSDADKVSPRERIPGSGEQAPRLNTLDVIRGY